MISFCMVLVFNSGCGKDNNILASNETVSDADVLPGEGGNPNEPTNPLEGCSFKLAINFNPKVTNEDGSCDFRFCGIPGYSNTDMGIGTQIENEYMSFLRSSNITYSGALENKYNCGKKVGCTYSAAENYDPSAELESGLCRFKGCTLINSELKRQTEEYKLTYELVLDEVCPSIKTENFIQNSNKHAGILWVVDNSGSMRTEQANLATNFTSFIEEFNPNIKFTMGITTTDSKHVPSSMNRLNSSRMNQNRTKFINNFKEMIQVGIRGSSREAGLSAAENFLGNNELKTSLLKNNDSHLIMIFISDEPDKSRKTAEEYLVRYSSHINSGSRLQVYSILDLDNSGRADITMGEKYNYLVNQTQGFSADIHSNFKTSLTNIASKIQSLLDQFSLSSRPAVSTIQVHVNGVVSNDWEYNEALNAIKFNRVPPAAANIKITYYPEQ